MAGEREMLSDTENVEKPVREQLQKATINAADLQANKALEATVGIPAEAIQGQEGDEVRGRQPQKKRSFEQEEDDDTEADSATVEGKHRRKRSRDSTLEEETLLERQTSSLNDNAKDPSTNIITNGDEVSHSGGVKRSTHQTQSASPEPSSIVHVDEAAEGLASPKTKRSRLHSSVMTEESARDISGLSADTKPSPSVQSSSLDVGHVGEHKVQSTSGFSNTSATSPFGALAGSRDTAGSSTKPLTSFTSSGFGALAKSSTSGFGSLGKSSEGFGSGSSFATDKKASLGTAIGDEEDQRKDSSPENVFGGALGKTSAFAASGSTSSGFGSGTSAFGKVGQGGGFGGNLGGSGFGSLAGAGLSSFASGKPSAGFASSVKPSKAFGVSAEDEDDDDEKDGEDDESGFKSPISQEEDKQDERFYQQDLETGEEDEMTEYSCRAKLYNFAAIANGKKEWRERGLGVLRLNVSKGFKPGADEGANKAETKTQARFLMRADGSHRVVLNTPIKKEIKFGAPTGGAPQGGYMYFMGTIDKGDGAPSGLELLQLKVRRYALPESSSVHVADNIL
nr:brefeldin a resistance protein [Quercus suber]